MQHRAIPMQGIPVLVKSLRIISCETNIAHLQYDWIKSLSKLMKFHSAIALPLDSSHYRNELLIRCVESVEFKKAV